MPPKSKKDEKDEKKVKRKVEKKLSRAQMTGDVLNERTKEYYLVEIQDLENRLTRYQSKHDELAAKNTNYQEQFNTTLQDEKEAVTVYSKTLEQRTQEIIDTTDRLTGLQQAKDVEREAYEAQLQQLRTEYKETKEQLISENIVIGSQLQLLDDFKVHKSEVIARVAALEEQVKEQRKKYELEFDSLNNKDLQAKDRMKSQMVERIHQVASGFRKQSEEEMAETVKRTIRENVAIHSQIGKMSDRTSEIEEENKDLKMKIANGRQRIAQMEMQENELTKNLVSSRKIQQMLNEQLQNKEQLIMEAKLREEQCDQLQAETEVLKEKLEETSKETVRISERNIDLRSEMERSSAEIQKEEMEIAALRHLLSSAAEMLGTALANGPSKNGPGPDNMLKNILNLLKKAKNGPADMNLASDRSGSKRSIFPPISCNGSLVSQELSNFDDDRAASLSDENNATTDRPQVASASNDATTQTNRVPVKAFLMNQSVIDDLSLEECEQVLERTYPNSVDGSAVSFQITSRNK